MKKMLFLALAAVFAVSLMAAQIDVVKGLLPDAGDKATVFKPTEADVAKIKKALGEKTTVKAEYELYVSKTGVVVIEEQLGKWGMIKSAVLIDPATKKFRNLAIVSMSEKRGVGIKTASFIKQFEGKTSADAYDIGSGIRAVSGATVSSRAIVTTVKRALMVYDMYLAGTAK